MYIKIHKSYRTVVAICDSEIIGKKFEEGLIQLDLKDSFYKDRQVDSKEAIRIMQMQAGEDSTFNIVGEKAINSAIEAGIVRKENVKKVQGIPFILVF